MLKIEKLSHIIGTALILEMARAYGLRPRLWLLIYRGYYTVARRYEFYVRVARTISILYILFLPRKHKIHIFEPTCNVLFIIRRLCSKQQTRREKPIQQKQKAGIVTPLIDTTLTKVTYGKYATRVPVEVAYGIYEWFSSQ